MTLLSDEISNAVSPKPAPAGSSYAGGNSWITEAEAEAQAQDSGAAIQTAEDEEAAPANEEAPDEFNGILAHLPPFSMNRLRELRARLGDGLDLGIHFYTRKGDPYKDEYEKREEPLTFWGINIISARTSGGKTLMLKSFCNYLLHEKPDFHAVFFSLEESELDIEEALFAGYLWHKERFPWLPSKEDDGQPPEMTRAITVKDIHQRLHTRSE